MAVYANMFTHIIHTLFNALRMQQKVLSTKPNGGEIRVPNYLPSIVKHIGDASNSVKIR
jgi:hypothetical protein